VPTKPDNLKLIALLVAGLVGLWGMFVMGWCTMYKIYIDVPMLLVLSNIVTGVVSSLTTLLVGRTIAQLNQQSEVKNQPQIDTNQQPQI
jgi:hypothetical protein